MLSSGLLALALLAAPGAGPAAASPRAPGPRAEGEAFALEVLAPATARPGAAGTARVVLTARGPYHVNRDYPVSFRPDASSTVRFAGPRVPLGDGAARTPCKDFPGETCAVSWPLPFESAPAGEARIAGVVSFSVCNPDRCLIEKVPVALVIPVR